MDWRTCVFILVCVQCWGVIRTGSGSTTVSTHNITSDFFVEQLIQQYGTTGMIDVNQLKNLLQSIHIGKKSSKESHGHVSVEVATNGNEKPHTGIDSDSACQVNWHNDSTCLQTKCLSASNIFQFHSISPSDKANATHIREMSATILYQAQNTGCTGAETTEGKKHKGRPSHAEMWGYGFLCVTLINLCSLLGMVFLPVMQKKYYKKLLMYMVALAVGTLAGSSLLFLIPDAMHLGEIIGESYIWKSTMVIGGIYMFFLVERLLKIIMELKENRNDKSGNKLPVCSASIPTHERKHHDSMSMTFDVPANPKDNAIEFQGSESSDVLMKDGQPNSTDVEKVTSNGNGTVHIPQDQAKEPQKIKSVAWMVIFGDGLHNFIDGLSIGAAFADRTMAGISVSLAVICEELPHELGDFAILLNSGMTMRQALKYNFLSACMCYLGMAVGILVGENTTGSSWIFALAGGMFLYISLVDMLPEVNHAAEEEGPSMKAKLKVFLLQNLGLITGYSIILLMAVYSSKITLD